MGQSVGDTAEGYRFESCTVVVKYRKAVKGSVKVVT